MSAYPLPWYTSIWWVFLVFSVSLIIFHLAFVWIGRLTSIQWKQIDYIWVLCALLGVLGSVEQSRSLVVRNEANSAEYRIDSAFKWVLSASEYGTPSAICRNFVRSELSPPQEIFMRIQQEFDLQCEWFKDISTKLREIDPKALQEISVEILKNGRPAGGERWAYEQLDESAYLYNVALAELKQLRADAGMSVLQEIIQALGPALLALAIALRITKVSGEISIERRRSRAEG